MPSNRPDRSRDDKAAEILEIAQQLFLDRGYAGTTISAIARQAGIATNVVHWYFATKDELFVAVLDALQSEDLAEAQSRFSQSAPGRTEADLEKILTEFVWRRLDRGTLRAVVRPLAPGDELQLRRDLVVRPFETVHRVPSQGYLFERVHKRLKEPYQGMGSEELSSDWKSIR